MKFLLGAALAGLALLPGCGGSSSSTTTPQPLNWTACEDVENTQCTTIQVPIDHTNPGGAKATLRLARVRADDQATKLGMMFIIPGGPGVGISDTFGTNRKNFHIDDFFSQYFDVVSLDPRGVGESSLISCPGTIPTPIAPFDTAPTPDQFAAIADANAAFVQTCFQATDALMGHLSSIDTADDIESIRLALTPNRKLVAYSASYGTLYSAMYLERYGSHVKTLVMDGVFDHSLQFPMNLTTDIGGTQDSFNRFSAWCPQNASCGIPDVGNVFDQEIALVPQLRWIVPQLFAGGPPYWLVIADLLNKKLTPPTPPAANPGALGLFLGVTCEDEGPQGDYAALLSTYTPIAESSPRFAWKFWDATPQTHGTAGVGDCVGWPYPATNPPHVLQVGPHPNVLVANNTHDPATPLTYALSVWSQIPRARLLIADVDGHQSMFFSQCAYENIRSFLLGKSLPDKTMCSN